MNSAKQLRCYIDTIIKQTIDDLNRQKNVTNEAFRQRIEQTREAKTKLELQHSEVCKKIRMIYHINLGDTNKFKISQSDEFTNYCNLKSIRKS